MTPEQQLRDEWRAMDFDAPAGLRTRAAVSRLLDPIPDETRDQIFNGLPAHQIVEWYRAWLIGGES